MINIITQNVGGMAYEKIQDLIEFFLYFNSRGNTIFCLQEVPQGIREEYENKETTKKQCFFTTLYGWKHIGNDEFVKSCDYDPDTRKCVAFFWSKSFKNRGIEPLCFYDDDESKVEPRKRLGVRTTPWINLEHRKYGHIWILGVHLSQNKVKQRKVLREVSKKIRELEEKDSRWIVVGDFNLVPESLRETKFKPIDDMSATNICEKTGKYLILDYIFVDNRFNLISYEVDEIGELKNSDHAKVEAYIC